MAKSKWILWLVLVYGFSALCYLPGLLELWDVEVPPALSYLRNGFVLIPAIVSFSFLLYSHSLKAYFVGMLFNVCFLAPVAYNVSVLAIVLVCCLAFKRIYSKEEEL